MISRDEMPQLTESSLKELGIPYRHIEILKTNIYPTQKDRMPFNDDKYMERYYKIIYNTYKPLVIDKEGNLIDGHHRHDIMQRMKKFRWVRALQVNVGIYEVLDLVKNTS
tara:strand:+ start:8283 stop:8612 length:330 start_codon:yes stop_codon:yes gene_type:complete